jgi:hypothetical protein
MRRIELNDVGLLRWRPNNRARNDRTGRGWSNGDLRSMRSFRNEAIVRAGIACLLIEK